MAIDRPIMLAVVGDSAAGKTTLAQGIADILGRDRVTHVCTDDCHKYDRRERAQLGVTPLHPESKRDTARRGYTAAQVGACATGNHGRSGGGRGAPEHGAGPLTRSGRRWRLQRRVRMVMMSGDCGCWTSLATALGASMLSDGDRGGVAGTGSENADTRFCLWCGEPNVDPELAEEARFPGRSRGDASTAVRGSSPAADAR